MKKVRFLFLLVLLFPMVWGQVESVNGYWVGYMEMMGKRVDLSISLIPQAGLLSSDDLMLLEQPLANVLIKGPVIEFTYLNDVEIIFKGKIEKENILGTVHIQELPPNIEVRFSLSKQEGPVKKSYVVETLKVPSSGVTLSAEIYLPESKKIHPGLVLLHGSSWGEKQRRSYEADFFAGLGFEVLIFDKRGEGASTGNPHTASYDDLAGDAVNCLKTLKNRKSVDSSRIGIWGISQGGMLIPLVGSRTEIPTFFIAVVPELNGAAEAAAFSDYLRVLKRGFLEKDGQIVIDSHRVVAEMIKKGCGCKDVETFINQNARKFPFMNYTGLYGGMNIDPESFTGLYWQGRGVNFLPLWKKLDTKTLAVFAEDDEYVDPIKNIKLLEGLKNPKIETKRFARAGHNMKKSFNPQKYPDLDWPRKIDAYVEFVEAWLRKEKIISQ